MTRPWRVAVALLVIRAGTAGADAPPESVGQLFAQGNRLYQAEDFSGARDAYREILELGYESASVYYNLGNTALKVEDVGRAVWAYARAADRLGVDIHNLTEVRKVNVEGGRVTGVETNRGNVACGKLLTALAGWSSILCNQIGVKLPLVTHPLQAMVTESYKPWLHHVVVSANLHIYMSQTDRGELVCGNGIDVYPHYGMRSTLGFLESYAAHVLELFPILHNVKVQRQWAGLCDMTPDYSPIISPVDEIQNLYINCGWGTYGFKAAPASGLNSAKMIAGGQVPENIQPFRYNRFRENRLVGEKAAAAVSS